MANILIGTCGWTDRALLASGWYPPGHRDTEGRLRHYATRFPVVEADSPYYALPTASTTARWAERTPDGFRFDVKAHALLTGHPTRPAALPADLRGRARDDALLAEVWTRYAQALDPLRRAGRLGTLLFQYPPSLAPGPRAETFVRAARERARDWPFAVEFRNPAWWHSDRTAPFLADLDATAVAVDTVRDLPGSLPPDASVTTPRLALVRFHGRSPHWGTGSKEDRFRHAYSAAELAEWLPRIRRLADRTDELHLLFNNCCGDAAVRAAETMHTLLTGALPGPRTETRSSEVPGPAQGLW
ncbi:DUF72 domain-containing protein [Streptomyces sp. NEAU-sy36]|uniref:DUF72 domain-containing protein n=1 Tax=unclassified Streptomyces TaxID=2593676 RepID=UPI0015D5ADAE|nr:MULTISPECIES: DUF72 domain-containing protein [unclassified Streptomyces]QLJ00742.1 DUF72 domain-containing protein [Streptomyces sp. NEAU-sy36]